MAKCLNCGIDYFEWEADKKTIFQTFCSIDCFNKYAIKKTCEYVKHQNDEEFEEFEEQDWPRVPALKYKVPVGEIACPHCGTVQHGILNPFCGHCDKPYWTKEEMEEENNPNFYENDKNSPL